MVSTLNYCPSSSTLLFCHYLERFSNSAASSLLRRVGSLWFLAQKLRRPFNITCNCQGFPNFSQLQIGSQFVSGAYGYAKLFLNELNFKKTGFLTSTATPPVIYQPNLVVSPMVKLSGERTVILNSFPLISSIPLTSLKTTVSPSLRPCFLSQCK